MLKLSCGDDHLGLVYGVNATFNNISFILWLSVLFVEETGLS